MTVAALEPMLRDMAIPIGGRACDVEVHTHTNADGVEAVYTATMRPFLYADIKIRVDRRGLEAGADVEKWINSLVDEKLRPFTEKLDRAASAAAKAWQEVIDE